jgi:hypothetical protein
MFAAPASIALGKDRPHSRVLAFVLDRNAALTSGSNGENQPCFPRLFGPEHEYNQEEEKAATFAGPQSVVECGQRRKLAL